MSQSTATLPATYTRLRNGGWGIRIQGKAEANQVVAVRKRSGETRNETVGRVLWTDGSITLASIKPAGRVHGRRLRHDGTFECFECGDYVQPGTQCWETGMTH